MSRGHAHPRLPCDLLRNIGSPSPRRSLARQAGLMLSPLYVVTLDNSLARADDRVWTPLPDQSSAGSAHSAFSPWRSLAGLDTVAFQPAAPLAAAQRSSSETVATQPGKAQWAEQARRRPRGRTPTITWRNWDVFASVTVTGAGVTGSREPRPATRATVTPAIWLQHLNRSSKFVAYGELSVSGSGNGVKDGPGYIAAIDWRQDFADRLQLQASAIKGRRAATPHLSRMARRTDMAIDEIFGPCPISGAVCDFFGGALRGAARQGDIQLETRATAFGMRWNGEGLGSGRASAAFATAGLRASWERSHRFAPFMDGVAQWRHNDRNRQGMRRLVGGVRASAIGLFSGAVFAGIETPTRGPSLPAVGGEIVWSPRRNLDLGLRGETGSAANSSAGTLFAFPADAGRRDQAKRRLQGGLFLHWSTHDAWRVDLGANWVNKRWLGQPAGVSTRTGTPVVRSGPGARRERARSASGRLTWTFTAGWAAQLDVEATYTSRTGRLSRRDVVVAVGLRKDVGP